MPQNVRQSQWIDIDQHGSLQQADRNQELPAASDRAYGPFDPGERAIQNAHGIASLEYRAGAVRNAGLQNGTDCFDLAGVDRGSLAGEGNQADDAGRSDNPCRCPASERANT